MSWRSPCWDRASHPGLMPGPVVPALTVGCVGTLISCGTLLEVVTLGILLSDSCTSLISCWASAIGLEVYVAAMSMVPLGLGLTTSVLAMGSNWLDVVNWKIGQGALLSGVTAWGAVTLSSCLLVPVGYQSSSLVPVGCQSSSSIQQRGLWRCGLWLQLAGNWPSSFHLLTSSCMIKCFRTIKSKA